MKWCELIWMDLSSCHPFRDHVLIFLAFLIGCKQQTHRPFLSSLKKKEKSTRIDYCSDRNGSTWSKSFRLCWSFALHRVNTLTFSKQPSTRSGPGPLSAAGCRFQPSEFSKMASSLQISCEHCFTWNFAWQFSTSETSSGSHRHSENLQ